MKKEEIEARAIEWAESFLSAPKSKGWLLDKEEGYIKGYSDCLSEMERVREGEVLIRLSISDAATIHSWIESIVTCGVSETDIPVFERLAKAINPTTHQ